MSTNLVMYDVDLFLDKYTRFMTKDIYISKLMYDNFLKSYDYLYDRLENDAILYRENFKYKKMFKIRDKKDQMLRLHNQKYLKRNIDKYVEFFNNIKLDNELDSNQRNIILSNEDNMLVINNKNVESLIVGKVKYLVDILRIKENKILVIMDDLKKVKKLFNENNLELVNLINLNNYKENLIKDKDKCDILSFYIINILFKDKEKFRLFYEAFSNNIYLNDNYEEYDNFSDYHNYMYRRMFLDSKLSLNRFIDKEIKSRKRYLRTIKNELVQSCEEVNVGNYLCLNGVLYKYLVDDGMFLVGDLVDSLKLKIVSSDNREKNYDENIVYINEELVRNNTYKDILNDELNSKNIKLNKMKDEDIYEVLKNSKIDSYFSEFVENYLIKYLDFFDINNDFIKFSNEQINVLRDFYDYYRKEVEERKYITMKDIYMLLENKINSNNYKYVIVNSDIDLRIKSNVLKIVYDYNNIDFIKENIKLLYDCKRYLNENKVMVAANSFLDETEINKLSSLFLKSNLDKIKDCFFNNNKKLSIYLYDDSSKISANKGIHKICYEVIRKNRNVFIGINSINEIDNLIYKDYIVKFLNNRLLLDGKFIVGCDCYLKIRNSYDRIILPFLVKDSYHENLLVNDNDDLIKYMIFSSLSKCKDELIILCPSSKRKKFLKNLRKLNNVNIFE